MLWIFFSRFSFPSQFQSAITIAARITPSSKSLRLLCFYGYEFKWSTMQCRFEDICLGWT